MNRRAFTLIETIATIVILGTISTIGSAIIWRATEAQAGGAAVAQLHSDISLAMERIVRELRGVEIKGGGPLAPRITSITPGSIEWNAGSALSLIGDGLCLTEEGGEPGILLDGVIGFSIQTYDESDHALPTSLSGVACDPVRRIRVTITAARDGATETVRTKVFIRSMMSGAGS